MEEERYTSRYTGQQIDDAVGAVANKADVTNIGGAKKLAMNQSPILALVSVEQVSDASVENNKMWWSTDGGKLKYKQSGQIYTLADSPPYLLYYCGETIYKWDGKGFTAMSSGGGGGSSDYPPAGGIPATDLAGDIPASKLASAIQTSLNKANSAYQKPSTGIPSTDLAGGIPATKLASAVQITLGKAETAVQPTALTDLFASIVYDSTTNRFNFYGKGDTSHTTPLAYIEASQLGGIADNLDTNDASMGLSAKQGYILRTAIDTLVASLANLAFNGEKPTMPWDEQSVPEGDISNYVQDGLVFHLDGINKGNNDNAWTDLVGGVDFPNHGATALENGWQFDGVDDYLGYANDSSKSLNFIPSYCTIEVCCYDDEIGQSAGAQHAGLPLFYFGAQSAQGSNTTNPVYLNLVYSNQQKYINGMFVDPTSNVWKDTLIETIAPHILSVNKERAFDNEQALVSLGVTHWDSIKGGRTIGAKQHPNTGLGNFAKGKIFAIRIYNRILSEQEMRQNQRVDNARFNLGIALPSAD